MKKIISLFTVLCTMVFFSTAEAVHKGDKTEEETLLDWVHRIHLNGTLEIDYLWTGHGDLDAPGSGSSSDLFISTVGLGVEVDFTDLITGQVLFLQEDVGLDGSEFQVDEAMLKFRKDGFPLYLEMGKRPQPFGVFENHLLNDPMTQDAYETNTTGVTFGVKGPLEGNFSATPYKGEEMMDHLFESELFDAETVVRAGVEDDDFGSFILSASFSPVKNSERLTLFGGFLSEPGRVNGRNETLNAGLSLHLWNFSLDGEYMRAVNRERFLINDALADREFKESVLSVSLAYGQIVREREMVGGAIFAERKAHRVTEPLELGVRYERFDDDGLARASQSWSVKDRISAGARYSFFHDIGAGIVAFIGAEYRHTNYEVFPGVEREDTQNEVLVRTGVNF